MRALTTQLVQEHRRRNQTIDALSLFFEEAARSQSSASEDDLEDILKILLGQYPTFLVMDGIEEAHEPSKFLHKLHTICEVSDTKAVILIRPTIRIPPTWCGESSSTSCAVHLNVNDNYSDFCTFFEKELYQMIEDGLFGNRISVSNPVGQLARTAHGIFLWADLFIRYLYCDGLTPQERLHALSNVDSFEGLDSLYEGILTTLERGHQPNKRMASNIFRWTACTLYSISTTTLRQALAIEPGQRTTPDQYLCDYPACLPRITGALVEVFQGKVSLIHTSFREYLDSERSLRFPHFSLKDKAPIHAYIATQCFSYLAHDVPKEPLHKESLLAPDKAQVTAQVTAQDIAQDTMQDTAQESSNSMAIDPAVLESHLDLETSRVPLLYEILSNGGTMYQRF